MHLLAGTVRRNTMKPCARVLVFFLLASSAAALKLPDFVKKCSLKDPEFNACALKNAREALPHIVNGLKKFHIPVLDPLIVKEIRAVEGQLNMTGLDIKAEGMRKAILESISFDFDQKKVVMEVVVPEAHFSGRYEVSGKLGALPIKGKGTLDATFYHLYVKYVTTFDLTKHADGQVYLEPKKYKVEFDAKNMKAHLGNLFNGNKVLGDTMNKFINENWRTLKKELGQPTYDALGSIAHKILSDAARMVPYKDLFDDTE